MSLRYIYMVRAPENEKHGVTAGRGLQAKLYAL